MTVNNFTTGRDVSVQINTGYGPLLIPATAILNFKANPEVTKLKSKGIDGVSRHGVIPDSWKGSFNLDRLDQASLAARRKITVPFLRGLLKEEPAA